MRCSDSAQRASDKCYLFAVGGLRLERETMDSLFRANWQFRPIVRNSCTVRDHETNAGTTGCRPRASPEMHFRHVLPINPTVAESVGNSYPRDAGMRLSTGFVKIIQGIARACACFAHFYILYVHMYIYGRTWRDSSRERDEARDEISPIRNEQTPGNIADIKSVY